MASRFDSRVARGTGLFLSALVAASWSGPRASGSNTPPVVDAGADQSLALPGILKLQGSVSDDGLPGGRVKTRWSVVSGPGSVHFADRFAPATRATVSRGGRYVLRLSADDGELRAHDDVTFDVAGLPGNVITLDPETKHQTITGWEATASAQQDLTQGWDSYKARLFDLAVNDLGITRVRLEVRSGVESDRDYWTLWRTGQIPYAEWRARRYATVNDDGDPNVTDPSGFHFSELDSVVRKIVLPLRRRVLANGEPFHVNVCYVAFVNQIGAGLGYDHYDANEYAEFALATYRHLKSTFGIEPDSWEILLEPDNVPGWFGTTLGHAMAALGPRLGAAGFTPRFVAPSSASMALAVQQFDQLAAVPGALDHMAELSYHRYHGVSTANLRLLQERARAHGLATAHLEHIGADYEQLHEDLKLGNNSAWAQYVLATLASVVPDNGTAYYVLDDSIPSAPVVHMGSRTPYLRQYTRYVRPGSVRIEATSSNAKFDPVTFVRPDGGYVTVVKARARGTFHVRDLPAGTYGISYTTQRHKGFDAPDVVLIEGQILTTTIPGSGVITIHARTPQRPDKHVPEPAGATPYGCGINPAGSLTLTGNTSPGGVLDFHIDNPLGTQLPGSLSMLVISERPDPHYPCGTLMPGRGMTGSGAPGELLVRLGSSRLFFGRGPHWLGPGQPATISFPIPARVQLIGTVGYVQGCLRDLAGPVRWGLTNGLRVEIGL